MSPSSLAAGLTSVSVRPAPVVEGDARAARIMAVVDKAFLTEMGWDPERAVLSPPDGHRLVVRPVCQVDGCSTTATNARRICFSCQARLAAAGLGDDQLGLLPPPGRSRRAPAACVVAGCARERVSGPAGLCRAHDDQRRCGGVEIDAFVAHPDTVGLPALGPCLVAACPRQRRHPAGCYCEAHQLRLRHARRDDPAFDELRWRRTEPAVSLGGQVSLRGVDSLVVAQVLYGLSQRCLIDRVQTKEADLRAVIDNLRRQQVSSLDEYVIPEQRNLGFVGLAHSLAAYARRALATPESEVAGDDWDLRVFGHTGTLSFGPISQLWLRQLSKSWAADDLPRRRIRPGRHTSGGLAVRHHIGCVVMLSESLRLRPDQGERPGELGRADMEAFLNRLAYLVSVDRISADARIRATREVRAVLNRTRAMGLTRPGRVAAGLGEDFAIHRDDVPDKPESAKLGRDLPAEILTQLCAQLDRIASPETRTGIELAIDTGRRPEEICDLPFDCLARDDDGLAVLVFDNHKANRLGRRLPIAETTAQVIAAQQARVAARFPATPPAELKLLPTDRRNPDGRHSITAFSLSFAHREWVNRLPELTTADGTPFDRRRVVLYAYRHSYAQRHADAGVPIDVLRELMDHRKLDTTTGYYRVGEPRRREAVERVAALAFDRHGNHIWRQAQALLDSEHARLALGEVAVPYGVCTEPSNVKAGGGACPFRFRCAGCDHFRTDVSYLPDLHAYLDDLLRNRERLLAATDIDDWARAEAMPSEEEIGRIRSLIGRITAGVDDLDPADRASIDRAVEVVRAHRAVAVAMPQARRVPVDLRPRRHP